MFEEIENSGIVISESHTFHDFGAMAIMSERLEALLTKAWGPSLPVIIVTALVAFLLPILLHTWLYRTRAPTSLPAFLVIGPSGAGKTSLLTLASLQSAMPVRSKANIVLLSSTLELQHLRTSRKPHPQYKRIFPPPQKQTRKNTAPNTTRPRSSV